MNFASDNLAGALPEVMDAVVAAGKGALGAYGNDDLTKRMEARVSEVFERDCGVFLVGTGSATNALALSMLSPPIGRIAPTMPLSRVDLQIGRASCRERV